MATQPTVVTGTVTVSGDTTNAEARRIQELALLNIMQNNLQETMANECGFNRGFEVR